MDRQIDKQMGRQIDIWENRQMCRKIDILADTEIRFRKTDR